VVLCCWMFNVIVHAQKSFPVTPHCTQSLSKSLHIIGSHDKVVIFSGPNILSFLTVQICICLSKRILKLQRIVASKTSEGFDGWLREVAKDEKQCFMSYNSGHMCNGIRTLIFVKDPTEGVVCFEDGCLDRMGSVFCVVIYLESISIPLSPADMFFEIDMFPDEQVIIHCNERVRKSRQKVN